MSLIQKIMAIRLIKPVFYCILERQFLRELIEIFLGKIIRAQGLRTKAISTRPDFAVFQKSYFDLPSIL